MSTTLRQILALREKTYCWNIAAWASINRSIEVARCRMMVAVRTDFDYAQAVRRGARLRVATKYMQTARQHFPLKVCTLI